MNPFTHTYTPSTDTSASNDASAYPKGQFIDPALLQLCPTTGTPTNQGHQSFAEVSRYHPGPSQPQQLYGLSSPSFLGGHIGHPPGTSTGTATSYRAGTTTHPPSLPTTTPRPTAPAYVGGQHHLPFSNSFTAGWGQQQGVYFPPTYYGGFPTQQAYPQYQLPTPAVTPTGSQFDYNSSIGYFAPAPFHRDQQYQLAFGPPGMGYNSFAPGIEAVMPASMSGGDRDFVAPAPGPTASRQGPSYIPTYTQVAEAPSRHAVTPFQPIIIPSLPTLSSPRTVADAGESGNIDPPRATRTRRGRARATGEPKPNVGKKPSTRVEKKVAIDPPAPTNADRFPLSGFSNLADDMMEAPPSPKIAVREIPAFRKRGRKPAAKGKAQEKGQSEGAEKSAIDKARAYICAGLGPTVDTYIQATGSARNDELTGTIHPVPAMPGDRLRCRWDGCRYLIPATQSHIRAHMRLVHGPRSKSSPSSSSQPSTRAGRKKAGTNSAKVKCLWHPPLRVRFQLEGGESDPMYVASHALSYDCGLYIEPSSVFNHIGTHLKNETQPNPMAMFCCGIPIMIRGGHRCKKRGVKRKRDSDDQGAENKKSKTSEDES